MADRNPDSVEDGAEEAAVRGSGAAPAARPGIWSFCHLPFPYQLLVWAIRQWSCGHAEAAHRWSSIRAAFAKVNAEDATVPFLRLMKVIQDGAARPILIGEGAGPLLPDEARLVGLFARAVQGGMETSADSIRHMLTPSAACAAECLLPELAATFSQAGLSFSPVRTWDGAFCRPLTMTSH